MASHPYHPQTTHLSRQLQHSAKDKSHDQRVPSRGIPQTKDRPDECRWRPIAGIVRVSKGVGRTGCTALATGECRCMWRDTCCSIRDQTCGIFYWRLCVGRCVWRLCATRRYWLGWGPSVGQTRRYCYHLVRSCSCCPGTRQCLFRRSVARGRRYCLRGASRWLARASRPRVRSQWLRRGRSVLWRPSWCWCDRIWRGGQWCHSWCLWLRGSRTICLRNKFLVVRGRWCCYFRLGMPLGGLVWCAVFRHGRRHFRLWWLFHRIDHCWKLLVSQVYHDGHQTWTNPKPPTSASFVQTLVSNPLEKSSSRTGQYSWLMTALSPS